MLYFFPRYETGSGRPLLHVPVSTLPENIGGERRAVVLSERCLMENDKVVDRDNGGSMRSVAEKNNRKVRSKCMKILKKK